jgi:hypothetical protein
MNVASAIAASHIRRPGWALRPLLWSLAALDTAVGAFAAVAPHAFYRNVLGVDLLGPYNQHLLSDVGGFLGFGLLFGWAAWTLGRQLVRAACVPATLTGLLHFGYHAAHLEHFSTGTAAAQTAGLTIAVALPLLALFMTRSADRNAESAAASGGRLSGRRRQFRRSTVHHRR